MSLILRIVKGSPLTHAELDDNFVYLDDRISGMTSTVDVAPYNGGTTYTGSMYVSYAGNIYLHISGTPTTGVIPSSDDTKWQLVSAGVLIHEKNKDTYLDFGGVNQVAASELRTLIDNSTLIITTFETLSVAIQGGTLIREAVYLVPDNAPIFYAKASTGQSLYPDVQCVRYIPKHTSVGGTYDNWVNGGDYAVNDKVVYGNYVYKNLTGDNSGFPRTTSFDWEVVDPLVVPSDYILSFVKGRIQQRKDYGLSGIIEFQDSDGNDFISWEFPCINASNNKFINSFWFGHALPIFGTFTDNVFMNLKAIGASFEIIYGSYSTNVMNKSWFHSNYGIMDGEFNYNICENVVLLSATESTTSGFRFNRNVVSFPNTQGIPLRPDAIIEACVINSKGSNAVDTLDGSHAAPSNVLDLNDNGNNDVYGIFEIDVADVMFDTVIGWPSTNFKKIILRPAVGRSISTNLNVVGTISADGLLIGETGTALDLFGDDGDYAELEQVTIGGFTAVKITYHQNQ